MDFNKFQDICREEVTKYFNSRSDKTDKFELKKEDVFVVWYCKTLQNAKMYYELTYNGDKDEMYLDAYKKWENKKIIF